MDNKEAGPTIDEASYQGYLTALLSGDRLGLPPDFASKHRNSLGLQLVSDRARQLLGAFETGPSATFTVTFPARPAVSTSTTGPEGLP